jgi:hypothetical protein
MALSQQNGTINVLRLIQGRLTGKQVPQSSFLSTLQRTLNRLLEIDMLKDIDMFSNVREFYDLSIFENLHTELYDGSLASCNPIPEI